MLANVVASAYLVNTIRRSGNGDHSTTAPPVSTAEAGPVRYEGELPQAVRLRLTADMVPAASGELPDIRFIRSEGDDGVATRWFVPVTAWGTGVDQLSMDELRQLALGGFSDWSEVGGLPGEARFAVVAEDAALIEHWLGGTPHLFPDYNTLFSAMVPGSGWWSLVPVDVVGPSVAVLRVDGQDLWDPGAAANWQFVERWRVKPESRRGESAAERATNAIRLPPPQALRVIVTGDILQTRCTLARIEAIGDWRAPLATPLGAFLAEADLTIGSLDTSIQDFAEPYRCIATTNLTAPPQTLEALRHAGFDVLTVATNHTFDCGAAGACGAEAFLRTLELVREAGIRTVGGGRNLTEALEPLVVELSGTRIAILGFDDIAAGPPNENAATDDTAGTAPMDDSYDEERQLGYPAFYAPAELLGVERLQRQVRAAAEIAHIVIVLLQSGTEDTHDPSPRSIKAARAAIEAGADLVVGNQAHWVQAVEPRGKGFIAYALGNFIFDQVHTIEHQQGVLLEAFVIDRRLVGVRLHPYRILDQYRPEFVDELERRKILSDVFVAMSRLPGAE